MGGGGVAEGKWVGGSPLFIKIAGGGGGKSLPSS